MTHHSPQDERSERDRAFSDFVKAFEDELVGFAYAKTGDWATALDIVAETFLTLYTGDFAPHRFGPEESLAFGKRAVRWRLVEHFRKRSLRREFSPPEEWDPASDDDSSERVDNEDLLWVLIPQLTSAQRDAVVEYDLREVGTYAEVSARLGVSESIFTQRLRRARASLAKVAPSYIG